MPFKIDEQVVYPAFGIGRVAALVSKSFFEAESQIYYEVTGDRSTVWVQVDESAARGLRRLTRPDELAHYRDVVVTVRGPSSPNVMRSPRSSLTFAPMAAPHTLRCSIRQQAHLRKRSRGKATRMHRRARLRRRDCMTSRVMQMPRRAIAIVQPRIGY